MFSRPPIGLTRSRSDPACHPRRSGAPRCHARPVVGARVVVRHRIVLCGARCLPANRTPARLSRDVRSEPSSWYRKLLRPPDANVSGRLPHAGARPTYENRVLGRIRYSNEDGGSVVRIAALFRRWHWRAVSHTVAGHAPGRCCDLVRFPHQLRIAAPSSGCAGDHGQIEGDDGLGRPRARTPAE